jgi:cell wall-associated NlpC family hydrolase
VKVVALAVGVLCLSPILLAGGAVAAAAAATNAARPAASCTDPTTVAHHVAAILAGKKTSKRVPGLAEPEQQIPNAAIIVATGIALHVPARGQVVALATALQESRLINRPSGDRDSLGLFQQRPSQGWGTAQQILDPTYASTRFYQALLTVNGWQQLTVAQAAQAVQHSNDPTAYGKWQALATALRAAIAPTVDAASCAGGGGFGPIPPGTVPKDYTVPASAPAKVQVAIRWALGQLGTPYQWGGSCTDAHGPDPMGRCDCSSLMQMSYRAAGVNLSRTTYTQVKEGKAVPVSELRPGDLVFTEPGPNGPGHVGMYIGSGLIINAPHTGAVVDINTLTDWRPQIVTARRIVT